MGGSALPGYEDFSPNEIEYILFDWDGTLADTAELILYTFRETFRVLDIPPLEDEKIMSQIGRPLHLQARDIDPNREKEIFDTYRRIYNEHYDELAGEFPGVREALFGLRDRGYRMAIVTSKRYASAGAEIERLGLKACFEALVTADDTDRHKPLPDPALKALERLGAPAHEATFIGDSPFDLRCARAAGVAAGAVEWGPYPRKELEAENPDYWVSEPSSLLVLFPGV
jgi:pyrophosphatase PpaX